jgi:activator of HSP90 ATPase
MPVQTKTIEEEIIIKAKPHEVYEIFMDSRKHSKLTESEAKISRKVGSKFSIFEGSINGINKELEQDKKIVQSWRSEEEDWPAKHYSTVTFIFESIEEGTLIKFKHTEIPSAVYESVKDGWNTYYWEPLKNLLEK